MCRASQITTHSPSDNTNITIEEAALLSRVSGARAERSDERRIMGAPGTLQQNPAMRQLARFRHSFASIAVSGGDSLYLVGKVLGHRQSRTTERYAHLKDDPLRAVANRTSERIAAFMQGGRRTKVVPLTSPKASE